ncbi:MAG: MFS transporter [Planctomycetales bacterium]
MTTDRQRPTNTRWMIFALSCAVSFILYLHRYTWGFVKAEVGTEFGWDKTTLGWLDSAFYISYAVGQVPGGMLADWYGTRIVLSGMILMWTAGLGLTTVVMSLPGMIAARFTLGLGQAGCYPTLSKVTKGWFPPEIRTSIQGWVSSFSGRMGGAVSYVLFASLLLGMLGLTWRTATLLFAAAGVVLAIGFYGLFRNSPRLHPGCNEAECDLILQTDPEAHIVQGTLLNWGVAVRSFNLWMLSFQQFTCAFVDNIFSAWVPLFLLEQHHVDVKAAGWMSAMPLVGGALGGMTAGMLQSRLMRWSGNRKWSRRSIGLIGNLMSTVLMFVSLCFADAVAIVTVFFFLKFFADWAQPTLWGTATDIGGKNSASVFAVVNTAGSVAGFVAGPIMGGIVDVFSGGDPKSPRGWFVLFLSLGMVYFFSALSWLWIDCTRPLEKPVVESPAPA